MTWEKEIKLLRGCATTLAMMANEIESHGFTKAHATTLQDMGSRLLFVGVTLSYRGVEK